MVILAKIGDGLEIWDYFSQQLHHLNIPTGFLFQQSAGTEAVEITIDKQLQQIPRMVGRSTGIAGDGTLKPERCQVQTVNECIDEADRIIFTDVFVQRFGEQDQLVAIDTCDMTLTVSIREY